jgi:hypothetical protein
MFNANLPDRIPPTGRDPNLPGDRYGRLVLLEEVGGQACRLSVRKWFVRCDCGVDKLVSIQGLRSGHTTSCGCYALEVRAAVGRASAKHGLWDHPLYNTHNLMMQRCHNPEHKQFVGWGGRGITVCDRWRSVYNFIADMAPSYQPGLTLERVDNHSNYSPENCIWATYVAQARNRRSNRLVSYLGRNICLAEACEISGLPYDRACLRLRRGWHPSRALESIDFGSPIPEEPDKLSI